MCGVYSEQMQALMDLENAASADFPGGPAIDPLMAAPMHGGGLHYDHAAVKASQGPTMLSQDQLVGGPAHMHAALRSGGVMGPGHPAMMRRQSGNNVGPHGHAMPAPSQFRGVTRNGNAWQAGVMHGGRCAPLPAKPPCAILRPRAMRNSRRRAGGCGGSCTTRRWMRR